MEENDARRTDKMHNTNQQRPVEMGPYTAPPWEEQRRPRRRMRPGVIALIAFAAVLVGTALALYVLDTVMEHVNDEPFPAHYFYYETEEEDYASGLLLERAPTGDDVTLVVSSPDAKSLSLQEIYKKAIPSVVSVEGSLHTGTGIIISEDGYIVTNYHVVEGNTRVEICLQDQTRYNARLVGGDEKSDLAVLKIEANGLTAAEFGDSSALEVGDLAVAIGNPLGTELQGTMTDGIISAINRDVEVDGRYMTLLQTNAALNAGNSGGPLLNSAGQVVGINILKMSSRYSSVEGLGFAIPVANAKPIIEKLIQYGAVSGYPAIGITVRGLRPGDTDVDSTQGIYVESVNEQSDAYQKGLRPGDIIMAMDGEAVRSVAEMDQLKEDLAVGDTVELTIQREGEEMTLAVEIMDQLTFEE